MFACGRSAGRGKRTGRAGSLRSCSARLSPAVRPISPSAAPRGASPRIDRARSVRVAKGSRPAGPVRSTAPPYRRMGRSSRGRPHPPSISARSSRNLPHPVREPECRRVAAGSACGPVAERRERLASPGAAAAGELPKSEAPAAVCLRRMTREYPLPSSAERGRRETIAALQ